MNSGFLKFKVHINLSQSINHFIEGMPQHKSSEKRVRQEKRRNLRNRLQKQEMKTMIKKIKQLVADNADKSELDGAYRAVTQKLDRMAVKGYIKKNNASNKKSKLAKLVNKASV